MDFELFQKQYADLNKTVTDASEHLRAISANGRRPNAAPLLSFNGLTSDEVKSSPEFKKAKMDYQRADNAVKAFIKTVPKDYLRRNSKIHRGVNESRLLEGNYRGDLQRLVTPELHIDEYKSKMGNDDDIIVLSFKVKGKDPAKDLVSFLEAGYNYILDADVSPGEVSPGEFLVFVEISRRTNAVARIHQIVKETLNLTLQKMDEWTMAYGKATERGSQHFHETYPFTVSKLEELIPLSPKEYREQNGEQDSDDIAHMKNIADIPVNQTAPNDIEMESLRVQAGLL